MSIYQINSFAGAPPPARARGAAGWGLGVRTRPRHRCPPCPGSARPALPSVGPGRRTAGSTEAWPGLTPPRSAAELGEDPDANPGSSGPGQGDIPTHPFSSSFETPTDSDVATAPRLQKL